MTRDALRKIVADVLEVSPDALTTETDLANLETFDSVAVLSLMVELHDRAGINLGPSQAARLQRYGEIEELARTQGIALEG